MKKTYSIILSICFLASLSAEIPNLPNAQLPDLNTTLQEASSPSFSYLTLGTSGVFAGVPPAPEVGIGKRMFFAKQWAVDVNGGILASPLFALPFSQTSLYFYPSHQTGFYMGAGATVGLPILFIDPFSYKAKFKAQIVPYLWANIPFTLGYDFYSPGDTRHHFIQFQGTLRQTFTLSYGFQLSGK